ncbi:V-type ATPase subunit [Malonomonas rubra]|uniref:V-type ATPase subunit n=1 Tax=Malonomonas rubra TaxID=57040 RepID=UPI0026EC7CDD|nr:V-type ATPase subunit [Malonomonas rubra]
MSLLIEVPYAGAANDYLYARICARRAELASGGLFRKSGSNEPRQALMAEYRWVYRQANAKLRNKLLPIFEYCELRLLVMALRYLAAGEREALSGQLQQSLLQEKVIRVVETAEQPVEALRCLQREYAEEYPFFDRLPTRYLRQGPGGLEQELIGGYLQQSCRSCRDQAVKRFLLYLLDMRNLQALRKHLRWQVPVTPPLLEGGSLEPGLLQKIWQQRDAAALLTLMRRYARQRQLPLEDADEEYLLQGLTDRLRQAGREPLQLGVVIDYLWRCWLAAREQGVRIFEEQTSVTPQAAEVQG